MDEYGLSCVGERLITHKLFRHIPQQLDYVFQKGMHPKEIAVHKVAHSDHFPLAVTLTV
jgi:endonuclease/exonuclease/phosphatase (EEP) superfamily protein YafD